MATYLRRIASQLAALLLVFCPLAAACAQSSAPALAPDVVRRYEFGYIGVSLRYGYELLDVALERSVARYGPYRLEPVLTEMSIARLQREVVKGDLVNVVVRATNSRRETDEELIPIDIPLDKGLNGYRVAIIRANDRDRFVRVGDIAGLRQLRIGIGEQWNDVPIYRHNDIPLVAAKEYESLLGMLERERFDLFPRPATGIISEFNALKEQYPSLAIEQHLLIHYPLGVYAFVSKSTPRLAERIRYGLEEMQKDGSMDKHLDLYFAQTVADLHLSTRTIIELENPYLPDWAKTYRLEWR